MAAPACSSTVVIGSALLYFLLLYAVALTAPHLSSKLSPIFAEPFVRDPHQIAKIRSAMESRGYSLAAATIADILRDGDWELTEWEIQIQIERGDPITFLVPSDYAAAAAAAADDSPRPVIGVLCGKLRRRDFDRANGTALPSCRKRITVTRIHEGSSAAEDDNPARIADWSLYDDGRVVVHGIRGAYRERMRVVLTDPRRGVGISGEGIFLPGKEWEKNARRWLLERPVNVTGCEGWLDGGWRAWDCRRLAGYSHSWKAYTMDLKKEIFVF